jgi:hypothetical protein
MELDSTNDETTGEDMFFYTKRILNQSVRIYICNLLYTDGIRTGLIVKLLSINVNMRRLHIPLWILGYDRSRGLYVRDLQNKTGGMHD